MNDQIICPHCKKAFPASEVFNHELNERLSSDRKKMLVELEKEKEEIKLQTEKRVREDLEFKLKNSTNESESVRKANKELKEELLMKEQKMRELKEEKEDAELAAQKKYNEYLETARREIIEKEQKKSNERQMLLQKQLDDTKKALEDAERKASQTSQQLQGEVHELDLEAQLRKYFPRDEIRPVKKGQEGGDILQIVTNNTGGVCGSILWEMKRTKSWSNGWLPKLREDTRQANANTSVLVSDILPPEITSFGLLEKVWVTFSKFALPLAYVLRSALIRIAEAKIATEHKEEKMELLSKYIASDNFVHRFESQGEAIFGLKMSLEREKGAMKRIWKQREVELEKLMTGVTEMYGEFKGIMGQALPSIKTFELPEGADTQLNERNP